MARPYCASGGPALHQGQPANASGGNDAAGRGQAKGVRGMINVASGAAAFHLDGAGDRIDTYALHACEVNDEAVITGTQPGAIVAPAPDGDQELVLAGELDCGNDVSHVATADNTARPPIDHPIINFRATLIARIVRLQQCPTQTALRASIVAWSYIESSLSTTHAYEVPGFMPVRGQFPLQCTPLVPRRLLQMYAAEDKRLGETRTKL